MKIPIVQVRRNCLVYYEVPAVRHPAKNLVPIVKKAYSGRMSAGAAKRINKSVDILLQKSPEKLIYNTVTGQYQPFTLNFVTLTISCSRCIGLEEGYKNLLKPYLRKLRATGPVSYIWKAEYQKRGQLHYHITTNTFIPWQKIRNDWNNLQRKNRYLDEYAKKHKHYDANSIDVHAVYKIRDIGAYLSKYLAKGIKPEEVPGELSGMKMETGKVWDCSKDLKIKRFDFIPTSQQECFLLDLFSSNSKSVINMDHCSIFKIKNPESFLTSNQKMDYENYLKY